jgi:type IV secretory pathway VirJ component
VERLAAGRLGEVAFVRPASPPTAFVFVFADAGAPADATVQALARDGAGVVGVDLAAYRAALDASADGCHYVVGEIEALSHRLQREIGAGDYASPILVGVGEGATLVYAALAQAPHATIAGAVGVDPAPALRTKVPLCAGAPATPAPDGGFAYGATEKLPGIWRTSSPDALAADVAAIASPGAVALRGLPLTELPVAGPSPLLAVIYSGDGGWRDLDRQIGERFASRGVPVVGVDSLRYFWRRKSPEQVAADLAEILGVYGARWNADRAILVGYSFGAGVLPFAITRLPPATRDRIALVSLLGLGPRAEFQFQPEAWLGAEPGPDAPEVVPELAKLDLAKVQCVHGVEEADTACRDPRLAGAQIVSTAGGHHFDGDYVALADRILAAAEKASR